MEYGNIAFEETLEISENDAVSEKLQTIIREGDSFGTFEEVERVMAEYGMVNGAKYYKRDSRKLETAIANNRMRGLQIDFDGVNKAVKYSSVNFACVYGGRPYRPAGSLAARKGFISRKEIQCQAEVRFKMTKDGQSLIISYINEYHNHSMSTSDSRPSKLYHSVQPTMTHRRMSRHSRPVTVRVMRANEEPPSHQAPLCMITDVTSIAEQSLPINSQASSSNSEFHETSGTTTMAAESAQRNNGLLPTRQLAKVVIQQCLSAELLLKQHTDLNESQYLEIGQGIVVYICFLDGANDKTVETMASKILNMHLSGPTSNRVSILNLPGDVLIVPQATLGGKPNGTVMQYHHNIVMEEGSELYDLFINRCKQIVDANNAKHNTQCAIKFGIYGKRQALTIVSNGPFTHVMNF